MSFRIWTPALYQKILNHSVFSLFYLLVFFFLSYFSLNYQLITFHACILNFFSFSFLYVWFVYFIFMKLFLCVIMPWTNCDRDIFWQFCTEILSQTCMQHNTSSESSFQPTYCESESEKSLRSDSGYLTEKSYQKPDFILKPHTVEVKSGGSAIFLCRITGSPAPSVVWETNGKTINNDGRHKVAFLSDLWNARILM